MYCLPIGVSWSPISDTGRKFHLYPCFKLLVKSLQLRTLSSFIGSHPSYAQIWLFSFFLLLSTCPCRQGPTAASGEDVLREHMQLCVTNTYAFLNILCFLKDSAFLPEIFSFFFLVLLTSGRKKPVKSFPALPWWYPCNLWEGLGGFSSSGQLPLHRSNSVNWLFPYIITTHLCGNSCWHGHLLLVVVEKETSTFHFYSLDV